MCHRRGLRIGAIAAVPVPDLLRAELDHQVDADEARDAMLDFLYELDLGRYREPWQDDAACRGESAVMFAGRGEDQTPALALCDRCPVIAECQDWGDRTERGALYGVLGGETSSERTKRRRAARRAA